MDFTTPALIALSFHELVAAVDAVGAGQGKPEVVTLYRDWITAQPPGAPDLHCAWFNLGTELGHAKSIPNAIHAYRNALAIRPDCHQAAINLGLLLERLGQADAAQQVWAAALQSDDARIGLLNQRARLAEQGCQLAEASDHLRASLLTRPDQPDAVQHWLHLRQKMCQWPVLSDDIPGLSREDLLSRSGPLSALALTGDVRTQSAIAAAWIARKIPAAPRTLAPQDGYRHDRIRIGYLSSDFCNHAMSYLIAELFERHDRARFDIRGYCNSPDDGSDIRLRVIRSFDAFTSIRGLPDEDAAHRIREDEIDILVDLNGLTTGGRLEILRWKPAPVQVTYLGFIGPVPMPELDYLLCDDFVVPSAEAGFYRPQPLYIQNIYQANDSRRALTVPMSKAEAGLPDDRFVFCCFSNHYKITETMFAAWMDILRGAPDAVLWLTDDNPWSQRNLHLRAMIGGIDPSRIVFATRIDPVRYMARLNAADVFLDTFPYNAGTIASDAIRMGLPLLTLAGESFASRMAARLLHAIGADAGIAASTDAYVATAIALATDPARYAVYQRLFTCSAWAETIGDTARFTRDFESALTSIRRLPADDPPLAAGRGHMTGALSG